MSIFSFFSSLGNYNSGVLASVGTVAQAERTLLFDALMLMMIVVIPVILMTVAFSVMYRRSKKAKYTPNWSHNNWLEAICWGIPCVIIVILGILAWTTTHKYDPYRPLDIPGKPLVVQVVSLRWKWLFIYPEQHIATLNYLKIPVNRQIAFQITSDAPMNAFFIPQIASQIYAMSGMRTQLHAVAGKIGVYKGFSANYSGEGFADMTFKTHVVSKGDFSRWIASMKAGKASLTIREYERIAAPSSQAAPASYSQVHPNLFNKIIKQFTTPGMEFYHRESAKVITGV